MPTTHCLLRAADEIRDSPWSVWTFLCIFACGLFLYLSGCNYRSDVCQTSRLSMRMTTHWTALLLPRYVSQNRASKPFLFIISMEHTRPTPPQTPTDHHLWRNTAEMKIKPCNDETVQWLQTSGPKQQQQHVTWIWHQFWVKLYKDKTSLVVSYLLNVLAGLTLSDLFILSLWDNIKTRVHNLKLVIQLLLPLSVTFLLISLMSLTHGPLFFFSFTHRKTVFRVIGFLICNACGESRMLRCRAALWSFGFSRDCSISTRLWSNSKREQMKSVVDKVIGNKIKKLWIIMRHYLITSETLNLLSSRWIEFLLLVACLREP